MFRNLKFCLKLLQIKILSLYTMKLRRRYLHGKEGVLIMKKKIVSALLIATMMTTMFVGCGSKSASSETSQSTTGGTSEDVVTITYWGWDSNYAWPMFEKYEETHPNVHFEATAVEWGDMLTKTQQALASGSELPTIIPMDVALIENWKDMDILEDLTDYGLDTSEYIDSAIEKATTDDGRVVGLLTCVCPSGIAYKRDLAKEVFGTDDPDELQTMFSSYDDYIDKGADAVADGKYMFHSGQAVAEWLYFASDVATQNGDTLNYTDKMTDVFSKVIAMRDAGILDTYQNGTAEGNATYADDIHIFYPCPDWAITYYIEANDPDGSGNWGLIKAPVSYSHGGTALGISSSATEEQKQAAYDFIHWAVAEQEGAEAGRDLAGFITTYKTLTTDANFTKRADEEFFANQDISTLLYTEIANEMNVVDSSPWENSMISVRNDLAQQLMDDKEMTLEEALDIGREELEQLVTDDNITIK